MQNTLGALIESPVFSNGIGKVYFEAINNDSGSTRPTRIKVSIATNMINDLTGWSTNVMLDAETADLKYEWTISEELLLNAGNVNEFTRYQKLLNYRGPAKLLIQRWGELGTEGGVYHDLALDGGFTVIDNIRVSPPPTAIAVYQSPDYTGLGYSYATETP